MKASEHIPRALKCISCGRCEKVCPQHRPVTELMRETAEKLDQKK